MLPNPISWSYAFTSVDFSREKIVYLTIICAAVVYLVMMIWARLKDSKSAQKEDLSKEAHQIMAYALDQCQHAFGVRRGIADS